MKTETRTTCCYCGVGCGVIVEQQDGLICSVRGDPDHPANFGQLCSKGSQLHLTATPLIQAQKRLLQPQLRSRRELPPEPASWQDSIQLIAQRLADTIQRHGPDSVGLYLSGQLLTEDYYVFNKLARALLGTNNIDSNSRLCMSSAVAGYKQSLGSDAPPCSYEDLEQAGLVMIIGANPAYAHPVLFRRLERARKNNPAMKLIVVDPRCTDSSAEADLHLQIQPGSDVALLHGLLHICIWDDLIARDWIGQHTSGFAELRQLVHPYTPDMVARVCGISVEQLRTAAHWFAAAPASLSLYCQGLNQSSAGTAKNTALINLHLATGQIGRAGAGPFSLTGQPNAMGGREVGAMANLLAGHRDLNNPEERQQVASFWGIDSLPDAPGKTALSMFDAVLSGQIKVLWIVCTNPAQSLPDQNRVRAALEQAELVIVQEAFGDTATCGYADVLLPAASWAEKEGCVTNSERRISRVRAAIDAPGQARPDWWIATAVAQRLQLLLNRPQAWFGYQDSEQIWDEHCRLTAGRDLDISGLSYQVLEQQGPQQWPYPAGAQQGKARLYTDGRFAHPDGKARFIAMAYQVPADKLTARQPFALTTGRLRDHWHGMSRTGNLPRAFAHQPEPRLEMHPADLSQRGLKHGDLVELSNARGSQHWIVSASVELLPGNLYIPMHWGQEFVGGQQHNGLPSYGINTLCSAALDPFSQQPELKFASVRVAAAQLPWRCLAIAWLPPERIEAARAACREWFGQLGYAHCVPFGDGQHGLLFEAAASAPVPGLIEKITGIFEVEGNDILRYQNAQRNSRRIGMADGRLRSVLLFGEITGGQWLKDYLLSQRRVDFAAACLLRDQAPDGRTVASDRQVCLCTGVRQSQIDQFLNTQQEAVPETALTALKQNLGCGSQCGSCVPELKKILLQRPMPVLQ